jgi:hypothetical protein
MKKRFRSLKLDTHVRAYLGGSPSPPQLACIKSTCDEIEHGQREIDPLGRLGWLGNLYFIDACDHRLVFEHVLPFDMLLMRECAVYP